MTTVEADPFRCGGTQVLLLAAARPTMPSSSDMKTTVSIPSDVFVSAERFAKRSRRSRSEVYSAAVREYLARHASDDVTEAMNRVCAQLESRLDKFVAAAERRILERSEW